MEGFLLLGGDLVVKKADILVGSDTADKSTLHADGLDVNGNTIHDLVPDDGTIGITNTAANDESTTLTAITVDDDVLGRLNELGAEVTLHTTTLELYNGNGAVTIERLTVELSGLGLLGPSSTTSASSSSASSGVKASTATGAVRILLLHTASRLGRAVVLVQTLTVVVHLALHLLHST